MVEIGFAVQERVPDDETPSGFEHVETVPYALNLFFLMLWNTRFDTSRSYFVSDFRGFVRSCSRNDVLESIHKDFMFFTAFRWKARHTAMPEQICSKAWGGSWGSNLVHQGRGLLKTLLRRSQRH